MGKAEMWGVLVGGRLGNQLYPGEGFAHAAAIGLRRQHPTDLVEVARVDVVLLERKPLPRLLTVPTHGRTDNQET